MPWFNVDDGFHCHPKVLAAGNAAMGLWARLGSYCAKYATNGVVPAAIVHAYGTMSEAWTKSPVRRFISDDEAHRLMLAQRGHRDTPGGAA